MGKIDTFVNIDTKSNLETWTCLNGACTSLILIFFAGELNKEISLQKSFRFFAGVLVEGGLKFSFVGLVMI